MYDQAVLRHYVHVSRDFKCSLCEALKSETSFWRLCSLVAHTKLRTNLIGKFSYGQKLTCYCFVCREAMRSALMLIGRSNVKVSANLLGFDL